MNYLTNAIIYTRISTKKQYTGYSLDIQLKLCNEYCKINNYTIFDYVSEIKSAFNINNQKKLIKIINNYNNFNLIISDTTRLCRNLHDYKNLIKLCNEKNIIIHFIEDKLITSNINDNNIINKKIFENENESKILGYRIKKAIQYKKSINNYFPAILKYGYKYKINKNKKLIIKNNNENNIIKLIKNLYNNNYKMNILLLSKIISKKYDFNELKKKMNINMIVNFLNSNNILKRNNLWKYNSVYNIIKNF